MQLRKNDLFIIIHKALRSLIYNAGSKIQNADFSDETESNKIVYMLKHDLELLHEHAVHEDNIVFPEFKNDELPLVEVLEGEHREIESKLETIHTLLDKISSEKGAEMRTEMGKVLNKLYNEFAAIYLAHMIHEESTLGVLSHKYLSDEEIVGIRMKIQSNIPAERYRIWLNWMLKSMNNEELLGMFSGMKVGAPQQVFENVVTAAANIIEPARWSSLKEKLAV